MAFDAKPFGYSEGSDLIFLQVFGDFGSKFKVSWGDGSESYVSPDRDTNGDGVNDTGDALHVYGSDGNYVIVVRPTPNPGVEPIVINAYMQASETDDITFNTTGRQDFISSGSGDDNIRTRGGNDFVVAADGNDYVRGEDGDDYLIGGRGFDTLRGGEGRDLLGGGDDGDLLYGDAGNDFLYGDAGDDTLQGGDGEDYLIGGAGLDRLYGGAGADIFSFGPPQSGSTSDPDRDQIFDFARGVDHIALYDWGGMTFVGSSAFSGHQPEVRVATSGSGCIVFGDANGDGTADFSIRVAGATTLDSNDFFL